MVYIGLDIPKTNRVRKREAVAAAKLIAKQLGDDLLLVFTNTSASQLHLIYPSFDKTQPTLRRMVVERDMPQRTAIQQVSKIYWYRKDSGSIRQALDKAFDVEPVTKLFFTEYKRIFEAAKGNISGFDDDDGDKQLFAQTLFNRLMFIYFLSRKGWLNFRGDKDYLKALWRDYHSNSEQTNFYRDRLCRLFFFGLNKPKPQSRDLNEVFGSVPFLNGGLFEETNLDKHPGINVPDSVIEDVLRDLFDRFNFTVMESTPFDVEVAVDPEMLGKVFEELVTDRHDSGAYYTPRPVVSFMCREALKGYLEGQSTGVTLEAIARFVDEHDTSGISKESASKLNEALDEMTVIDPACGSGAYLLGMMQELVELNTELFDMGVQTKGIYDLKLSIIERNLYGVDIDEFAVNIAMLRLWLSLSIEYEGNAPPALPNLDFKVICGDSLLGPDPSAGIEVQGTLGYDAVRVKRLGRLKAKFMRTYLGPDKERLRRQIGDLTGEIYQTLGHARDMAVEGVVEWRVEFAEIFATCGGFDIVIANPPYISVEHLSPETKAYLFNYYDTCEKRTDIYIAFLERSLSVLNGKGLLSFIIPFAFTNEQYATRMRQRIVDNHSIRYLVDASSYQIFENAAVFNIILAVFKENKESPAKIRIHRSNSDFENGTVTEFWVDPNLFATLKSCRFDTNPLVWDAIKIKKKIWNSAIRLDQICLIAYGARLNHRSESIGKSYYISSTLIGKGRKFCEGRNIKRYSFLQEGWLNYVPTEHYNPMFPELFENEKLMSSHIVKDRLLRFAYDDSGFYNSHTVINCVRLDLLSGASHMSAIKAFKRVNLDLTKQFDYKYLLAVLNSTLTSWYFRNFLGSQLGFYPNDAKELPIPKISADKQRPFIQLANSILQAKAYNPNKDTSEYEEEIDRLIYDLYGLTEEEKTFIKGSQI